MQYIMIFEEIFNTTVDEIGKYNKQKSHPNTDYGSFSIIP